MTTCGDCGVPEGAIHELGCDTERCPYCHGQLISCDCVYELLGIDVSPGTWAYEHGLTNEQEKEWEALLTKKGRFPFILYPNHCVRCGELWPKMFMVPREEWEHYVQPDRRREMLCYKCYREIQDLIDANSGKAPLRHPPRFLG